MAYTGSQEERGNLRDDIKSKYANPKILITSYATLNNKIDLKFLRKQKFSSNIMDEGEFIALLILRRTCAEE